MKKIFSIFIVVLFVFFGKAQNQFAQKLSDAALSLTKDKVTYDPAYYSIKYPNGDVAPDKGVCTDVIIRAYRKLGIDLQKEVHEDMKKNFSKYPKKFGLKRPDTNIDHRRVPNLMVFFAKFGQSKSIETKPELYVPGDIVTWLLPGNLTHIGIVVNKKSADGKRYLIVHNIGAGQVIEDCLFKFDITGHYQYSK
ncbi:DUF1287 domain-containing protein [Chryseobacterium sp. Ch-15]|uniref:DUF1287 domain-containing protein n=1 Tax=Chryseobacterium muglaense TaxID=2893752 RepID=A0A9Q3UY29_9FLAO|nr:MULTISPECIES: DUF1287 domain-containing protein [Chryseobacterium]MBD3905043.1 DUF1287 domain-containing protein [Chryseobacterium muglaense]MBO6185239.1 DUF1287 domain-containing protein [Chryseobacterium sp.]MCC9035090.1 DUF1287 domain-containing protein [Chryseobacterium muglaense]MCM2554589.1 DUF1287 domain-containing protein [Chryseobacterium muglaense]